MNRGLVYIGKVLAIHEIPGAGRIQSLEVVAGAGGRWRGTAIKGQFTIGGLCQIYLQDCIVPETPEFAFLARDRHWIKIRKFLGVPSEILVMPQTLPGDVGDDVTGLAGVSKYEKPVPPSLSGEVIGEFPSFIPRTDEPNFQSVPQMVEALMGQLFYSTAKLDGTSITVFRKDGVLRVCSRKLEQKESDKNSIWLAARKFGLDKIPDGYAVQAELCGPKIQKNPLGLEELRPFIFQIYDMTTWRYLDAAVFLDVCRAFALSTVPIIDWDRKFEFSSDDELRQYAEGTYSSGKPREGVVIRPKTEQKVNGERLSFKVINPGA